MVPVQWQQRRRGRLITVALLESSALARSSATCTWAPGPSARSFLCARHRALRGGGGIVIKRRFEDRGQKRLIFSELTFSEGSDVQRPPRTEVIEEVTVTAARHNFSLFFCAAQHNYCLIDGGKQLYITENVPSPPGDKWILYTFMVKLLE